MRSFGGSTPKSVGGSPLSTQLRADRWSNSFNLVVGDTLEDRILFWNARLLIPTWLDGDLCCLRVTMDQLEDPEFLAILSELLNHRNRVNYGSGDPSRLTIRSVSLGSAGVEKAVGLVSSTKLWGSVTSEAVAGLDAVVPPADALQTARQTSRFSGELFPRRDWVGFTWSPPAARPPAVAPDHLEDAPPRQAFTSGSWCSDFTFQYDGPGPFLGSDNYWMLSRRWRMAGAFKMTFAGQSPLGPPPAARRSRGGNLSTFVSSGRPIETMKVPTAYEAFRHALVVDGAWAKPDAEHGKIQPANKVVWMAQSNEARYLTGVLGMAGGLQRAGQFLLHPFLREMFAKLGGSPKLSAEIMQPTIDRIRKLAPKQASFDLRSEREREALAEMIVKAAQTLKSPASFVSYDDLKSRWNAYRQEYWAANPERNKGDASTDWDRMEEGSLDTCLVELRRGQMMFQGHQWTCRKCHHRNWLDLGSLAPELSREVCKRTTQAPVDIRWLFRPNEFLIESLRDHSVLSLIWVLSALRSRARRSLIFAEPTWFGFSSKSDEPDAEADLLALVDGRALFCEVKSSWRGLRTVDIENFVELSRRLRSNVALLAVMETGTGPVDALATARAQLTSEGIEFELLTPNEFMVNDDPILQTYDNG